MPYPGRFLRLVAAGPLFDHERWSFSLSLWDSPSPVAAPTEVPAGVLAALEAFFTAGPIGNAAQLDHVKLNEIGADGHYVSSSETVEHIYETPIVGGGSQNPPPQIAQAVSLVTSHTRGFACRGRFFIPSPANAALVAEGGRVSVAAAASLATAATTFINALNVELDPYRVSVMSKEQGGYMREVRNVRIGRVLDTIRSRRGQIPEDYQSGANVTGYSGAGFSGGGGTF